MLQYCNNGSWCEHIYYCESRRACKLVENMLDYKYSNSSRLCTKTQLVGTISTILLKMISTRILDPITITYKISTRNGILDETHKISTSSHCSITHESRRACTHAIICTWSSRASLHIHRISTSPHTRDAHGRTHISTRIRTCIICNTWYTHLDYIITGVRLRDWHSVTV